MFRPARWRSEKNRVKAVFKLHFHVTQVFQYGMDALVLSIVPGDIGKPTTRLEKTTVRDGTCRWENPVYETVKFIQDPKTGKISDKIYHFLVSTGLPKASSIGEVSVNFADYVEATKPSFVSLPIRISHCDAVLHVSIQRLQENGDRREEDECEEAKLKSEDRSSRNHLSKGDMDETSRSYSSEDVSSKAIINRVELSSNYRTSSGSDMTLSSSDDSSGLDTPREIGSRKKNIHLSTKRFDPDPVLHHASPKNPAVNASTSMHDVQQRSHWDWTTGSEHRLSTDNSTYGSHRNSFSKESSQQPSPFEVECLKDELAALARQVDVSDMELQTLRKQIVKECKRGQELAKEIAVLKEERDAFKAECDNLRSFQKRMDETKGRNMSQLEGEDLQALVEEIRQELNYEKDLNANLRLQLEKMQESNAELVLAVQDLDEMLEQKNRDTCNRSYINENNKNSQEIRTSLSKCGTDDDEEQKALEELVKEHSEAKETHLLEKKIVDLYGEIEIYKREKDELEMQMEQLALDYEILKQENHSLAYKVEQSELQEQLKMQYECSSPPDMNDMENHIKNLEDQLKEQSEDFSNSLATIKALESHIRGLEEEMEKQIEGFEADLEAVMRDKVEQEQRAIQAEDALRKTRQKNAKTAERLQEEFRRLSTQMTTTFDANEKATMKALTEASEVRAHKSLLEEKLLRTNEELESTKADYEVKMSQLSNQIDAMKVQIQQTSLEIEDKTKQHENQKKRKEQVSRNFSDEIGLLKAENGKLNAEISCLREQVEGKEVLRTDLELMMKSIEESQTQLQKGSVERNELMDRIALLKKEAEESLNELNRMIHLKDEKETEIRLLQSELEAIRAQCSDLKLSLSEDEVEKEKLRRQVFHLKSELKKKEDALIIAEKRLRESNGRLHLADGTKTSPKNKITTSVPQNSKEIASLKEKIKTLEGMIQSKENALETSKTSFLEKEKELQAKIEELENKLEEFNKSIALHKVVQDKSTTTSNVDTLTELKSLKERNKSMESELKEMQERYLEMSLNFAEVESERQKLVMTVRNLKSIQKS